jgi:hypothetical protein
MAQFIFDIARDGEKPITGRLMRAVAVEWELSARTHSASALRLLGLGDNNRGLWRGRRRAHSKPFGSLLLGVSLRLTSSGLTEL